MATLAEIDDELRLREIDAELELRTAQAIGPPIELASPEAQIEAGFAISPELDQDILSRVKAALSADPQDEPTKTVLMPFKSEKLNKASNAGLIAQTRKAFERGGQATNVNFMFHKIMGGQTPEERQALLQSAVEARAEFDRLRDEDPVVANNWAQELYLKTVEITPAMASGIYKGNQAGLVAGGAALAASAIPSPLTLTPIDELAAYGIGSTIGAVKYWSEQGSGDAIELALQEGLTLDQALYVGAIAGPVYGAVEFSQVGRLLPGFKTIKKGILKIVINRARILAANVAEEVIQKGVIEGVVDAGKLVTGEIEAADIPAELKDTLSKMWNEGIQSIGPMMVLGLPGTSIDIANSFVSRVVRSRAAASAGIQIQDLEIEQQQSVAKDLSDGEIEMILPHVGPDTAQVLHDEQDARAKVKDIGEAEADQVAAVTPEKRAEAITRIKKLLTDEQFQSLSETDRIAIGQDMLRRFGIEAEAGELVERVDKAPVGEKAPETPVEPSEVPAPPAVAEPDVAAVAAEGEPPVPAEAPAAEVKKKPAPKAEKKPNAGRPAEQATADTTPETIEEVEKTVNTDFTEMSPQTFSLRKEAIARERERLGMDGVAGQNRESFNQWQKEAIKDKIPEHALEIATEIINEPRALSPKEIAGVGIRLAEVTIDIEKQEAAMAELLKNDADEADVASKATDISRLEVNRDLLIEAAPEIQQAAGRGLVALKMTIDRSFNLTAVLTRATVALKKKLSSVQKALFTKLTSENKELADKVTGLEQQVKSQNASQYIRTNVSARQLSRMSIAEKDANLNKLTEKLKKMAREGCDN